MQHKATGAESTILLDYVSPTLPATLVAATRRHDWAVAASCLASILLRLVIVASTSLLVLSPTAMKDTKFPVLVTSTFNGSGAVPFTGNAALRYYGELDRGIGLPYGSTLDFAFDTINLAALRPNSTLTTKLETFFPLLKCEVATAHATLTQDLSQSELNLQLNLSDSSCPTSSAGWQGRVCNPDHDSCLPRMIAVGTSFIESGGIHSWTLEMAENDDPCGNLISFSVVDFRYDIVSNATWTAKVAGVTAIRCQPSYAFGDASVILDTAQVNTTGSGVSAARSSLSDQTRLPKLFFYNMTNYLDNEMSGIASSVPVVNDPEDAVTGQYFDEYFTFMSKQNGDSPLSAFLDPAVLQNSASAVFRGIMAQLISQSMRQPSKRTVIGVSTYVELRLQVQLLSIWLMGVALFIVSILALTVLVFRPWAVVCRDPSSVSSNATILAASNQFQHLLKDSGQSDDRALEQRVYGVNFQTVHDAEKLVIIPLSEAQAGMTFPGEILRWWHPLSLSKAAMAISILLPLAVIITLELLQRRSDSDDGILSINSDSSIVLSIPSLVSALLLIGVAILYDSIDFATNMLAPFQALRGSTSRQGLFPNLLGRMPIHVLVNAVRFRYVPVFFSSTAAILGSFLTIIVSGLFTIESVPQSTNSTVSRVDSFSRAWNTTAGDNLAGQSFNLLEWGNSTYPALTYGELAFPQISWPSNVLPLENSTSQLPVTLSLPATRANLQCTIIPAENISVTYDSSSTTGGGPQWSLNIEANGQMPRDCQWHNATGTLTSSIDLAFSIDSVPQTGEYYSSDMISLSPDPVGCSGLPLSTFCPYLNTPDCPSLAFFFGRFRYNHPHDSEVTAYTCIQTLETVQTDTTFIETSMEVDQAQPPVVDETSAKHQQFISYNIDSFVLDWSTPFDNQDLFSHLSDKSTTYVDTSHFFGAVIAGPQGTPEAELVGIANQATLLNATTRVYQKYMAQAISANMRQNFSAAESAQPANQFPASIQASSQRRLIVNRASKIALQVILSSMCACAILAFSLGNMSHTLPHSPCTIAGVMSLLAGSELCSPNSGVLPAGAQWMSNKELQKALQSYSFSLGWWRPSGADGAAGRRFGIDVGTAVRADEDPAESSTQPKTRGLRRRLWRWRPPARSRSRRDTYGNGVGHDVFLGSMTNPLERHSTRL